MMRIGKLIILFLKMGYWTFSTLHNTGFTTHHQQKLWLWYYPKLF